MALGEFGFDLGPLIASAGVVGVALGLGAQTLVRDVLSGIFMLIEDQYGVGDTVDVLDVKGVVEKVGLRVTTVRDTSGTLWYLRNGEILKVGNQSQSG
jgi:small-conductance mechanosensitive channel